MPGGREGDAVVYENFRSVVVDVLAIERQPRVGGEEDRVRGLERKDERQRFTSL
jgi:hypothetical protein